MRCGPAYLVATPGLAPEDFAVSLGRGNPAVSKFLSSLIRRFPVLLGVPILLTVNMIACVSPHAFLLPYSNRVTYAIMYSLNRRNSFHASIIFAGILSSSAANMSA